MGCVLLYAFTVPFVVVANTNTVYFAVIFTWATVHAHIMLNEARLPHPSAAMWPACTVDSMHAQCTYGC
jgi:hypothetical protein